MWKTDGWDSDFKLGVVTPHADIGPEAETQAMLAGLPATVHGARVDFSPMHPGGTIDEKIAHDPVLRFIDPAVIDHTVESLSSSPLNAIGLAFTSSSFKIGPDREQELLQPLTGDAVAAIAHTVVKAGTKSRLRYETTWKPATASPALAGWSAPTALEGRLS